MGVQTDLRTGIGHLLHDAGVVTWTDSGAVDPASDPAPCYHLIYPDTPDTIVALSTYSAGGDSPTAPDSIYMLQVRTRSSLADVTSGDELDDAIARTLLGRYPITLDTGVRVETLVRVSGAPLGRDGAGRMERATNYRIMAYDPGPYRG